MKKFLLIVITYIFLTSVTEAYTACDHYSNTAKEYQGSNDYYFVDASFRYNFAALNCVNGYSFFYKGDYVNAIDKFEQVVNSFPDDTKYINGILQTSYYQLGEGLYNKKDYEGAVENYLKSAEIDSSMDIQYWSYRKVGIIYLLETTDTETARKYLKKALSYTYDKDKINVINQHIEMANSADRYSNQKKEYSVTNDKHIYHQKYIKNLKINSAWNSLKNTKKVIIAVVDDGVNINHPDITRNIWTNNYEIPGNLIDDDNNGYIDDYNGWNFVYNSNNLTPLGSHGTSVAGIIGAGINDRIGISGIVKDVEIMPIGVCSKDGCNVDNISKGIKYAVDNGANIVNLSLGGHQFKGYNKDYDNAIKYAFDKGVILVVAAGNGDVLSNQKDGVNTTINKISPVCNEQGNNNMIIGVGATNDDGVYTNWSNYGNCVDFYVPGEDIFTLSIFSGNISYGDNYDVVSGTSFSAPIISGIIGLGYNKYGKVNSEDIHYSLNKSITRNNIGTFSIDSSKYLTILGNRLEEQNNKTIEDEIDKKANDIMIKLKAYVFGYSVSKKIELYKKIILKIDYLVSKDTIDNDTKKLFIILKKLIIEEKNILEYN